MSDNTRNGMPGGQAYRTCRRRTWSYRRDMFNLLGGPWSENVGQAPALRPHVPFAVSSKAAAFLDSLAELVRDMQGADPPCPAPEY